MGLTPQQLITAATADSNTYAYLRGRIAELKQQGRLREAITLQSDYNARLARWKQLINNVKRKKNSSTCTKVSECIR